MIPDLKDKVVLITGASTGIGAAAAQAFGANGSHVVVHYNSSEKAARDVVAHINAAGGKAIAMQGNVMDTAAVQRMVADTVKHFGRIDVLINNAGGMVRRSPVAEAADDLLDEVLALNVRSVVSACREAIAYFRAQGGGNIINVTSIAARNGGGPGASIYAAAKGFVSTFTRGLAKELVNDRIRVNAVAPGVIATPFHEKHSTPQQLAGMQATIPMNRLGMPDECAGAFLYLASDSLSSYVTGQILEVNGGQYMP